MTDDKPISELAANVVADLARAGQTLATAESCTGGWIAKAVTDVAGSSDVFGFGVVSYSNAAKERLLGVQPETLAGHGAVSEPAVREMVAGALAISKADIGVAVSGIAGPGGGSDTKPVGTVWFAWARRRGEVVHVEASRVQFGGDRESVRRQSVVRALEGVRERLN